MQIPFSGFFILEHLIRGGLGEKLHKLRQERYPLIPDGLDFTNAPHHVFSAEEARTTFLRSKQPLLWRCGATETALAKWDLNYLKKNAGEIPVKILALEGMGDSDRTHAEKIMPFGQYIDLMGKTSVYLRFSDLLDTASALKADVPLAFLESIANHPRRINLQFFLGSTGTQTSLHAEMNCNVFVQISGRKRWILFPADATSVLNPPAAGRFYFFSPLNPLNRKIGTRNVKARKGWEVTLEPGDILLCPPFVWHTAENLSTSCGIGFKFNRFTQAFRASPLLFAMNMLARNPSYPSYLWQTLVRKRHPILSSR